MADNTDVTIKEEFDVGVDDNNLLEVIDAWLNESQPFYDHLRDIIDINTEYYKGNQTDLHLIRGKNSKTVENRIFIGTETIVPIVTAEPPNFVVEPAEENELSEINANKLQKVLSIHYDRIGIQEKSERFIRDITLKRIGVFKFVWDEKENDFDVVTVDPRRIRIPRFGTTVDELPYIIEELELSYQSLIDFFGEKKANKLLKVGPTMSPFARMRSAIVNFVTGVDNNDIKKRKNTFTVFETTTDNFRVWSSGDEILKKEPNPFYDFKKKNQNFFRTPKKHYIIKSMFQTDESLVGETDLTTQAISLQDNINKRKRQIENLSARVANPHLLIDSEVMDEETASTITNEEGKIIYGKDVAQAGKVRYESPGQVPGYLFDDLVTTRNEFDNVYGTHSTTRGEKSGQPTLGQDVLTRQADLGRIDLITRQLNRAYSEIAQYATQVMKVMYTDKHIFRMIGVDGLEIIEFNNKNIDNGMQVRVKAGNTIPTDEITQRQESINLFQLGVLDPLTLYERLKIPNPRKVFERLAKFRTGELFAEFTGQGQQQAQSGVPGQNQIGQQPGGIGQTNLGSTPQEAAEKGRQAAQQVT